MVDQDNHREITIETLATPQLKIQPAHLTRRFGATLIDSIIVGSCWAAIAHVPAQSTFLKFSLTSWIILFFVSYFYYFVTEGLFSYTFGKRMMKIRVVGTDGDPCTIAESAVRNLLRIVDWFPFCYILGLGFLSISEKRQRAGDRVAHTIVTLASERDKTPPPAPFLFH